MSQVPTVKSADSQAPIVTTCDASAIDGSSSYTGGVDPVYAASPATAEQINAAYSQIRAVKGWAEKIVEVANFLKIPDPGWLANAMWFESSLNPSETNKSYQCTGLIQFCPESGAKRVGKTVDQLRVMGAIEQMKYVQLYLSDYKGRMNSSADLYMAIFFPVSVGKGPSYSIYNWYLVKKGAAKAANYLKANSGIKTSGDYQSFADKRAKLPTHLATSKAQV
jgi:hypothetical protein